MEEMKKGFGKYLSAVPVSGPDRVLILIKSGHWEEEWTEQLLDELRTIGLGDRSMIIQSEDVEVHVVRGDA